GPGGTGTVLAPFTFGTGVWPATVPVVGDWDGDGKDGIGTYTVATGTWSLRNAADGLGGPDIGPLVFRPDGSGYPVVGDWNGDGVDSLGVRAGTTWKLSDSNTSPSVAVTITYGLANDLPVTWRKL